MNSKKPAPIELVDTHCHIQSVGEPEGEPHTVQLWAEALSLSPESIIATASARGVSRLICVGCNLEDSRLAIRFVSKRPGCWASIGLHPHEAGHYAENKPALADFSVLAVEDKVVAIGECGLDYYYEHSRKADQKAILRVQLELARLHHLPLIFHVREAFDDFWPIFDSFQDHDAPLRGVLHSFTDSAENLEKAVERNLYIGVNGIATFAKSDKLLSVYRAIPLDKLLFETDAPFLTPVPYRGTINEPKYVREIAEFMAKSRGESLATIAKFSTSNAHDLFGIN